MLALFRNNQFTTAITLALYVGLTHLAALLGKIDTSNLGIPEGGVLYRAWFDWAAAYPRWSALAAAMLVFLQALSVNVLADEFRLMGERNWFPGLFYALVAACLPDFLFLSPPLVAATFLPVILRRVFRAYNQPKATALVFDAAFWTAVAALFYPPAIFLLIAVFFSLNIMRSYTFREQMVSVTGVVVAFFLAWLWYFWGDRGWLFWGVQLGGLFHFYDFDTTFDQKTWIQLILPGLLAMVALLSYGAYMYRRLIQAQKCISTLYWFWWVAGLTALLQDQPRAAHFVLMAVPLGLFMSFSIASIQNRSLAGLLHWLMLGLVLCVQFYDELTGVLHAL